MAITDSTTTLDTTWAEDSFVAFTAGTLPTYAEMVTEVQDKLKRGTLSTTTSPTSTAVHRWLVRAKEELLQVRPFAFSRRFAYADPTVGEYRISLPPDFAGGNWRIRDQTNDKNLVRWPAHLFDLKFPDMDAEANGAPVIACVKNMELWLCPPVDGTTRLELEYDRSGDDNTALDVSFLPEIERFRCCDYALYEAFESLHDFEKATWYKNKWGEGLGRSQKADSRKKWADMGYQAISIFQQETARDHQK